MWVDIQFTVKVINEILFANLEQIKSESIFISKRDVLIHEGIKNSKGLKGL